MSIATCSVGESGLGSIPSKSLGETFAGSLVPEGVKSVYELVFNSLTFNLVKRAAAEGIRAATGGSRRQENQRRILWREARTIPNQAKRSASDEIDARLRIVASYVNLTLVDFTTPTNAWLWRADRGLWPYGCLRQAIEKHQPLLGLHRHIHESKGVVKIGRTTCINPGSVYEEGTLLGAVVDLEGGKVKRCYLSAG